MDPLYELKLKLISACDYRCQMCGHWREPVERLTTTQVLAVLREAAALGARSVIFSGGEPTLHRGLTAAVQEARALGLRVTLASNGGALRPGRLEELLSAGVDQLNVSLDSPMAAVHDEIRGVPGSHGQIVAGLGRAAELGHRVALKTVVTRCSAPTLAALPALADQAPLQSLSLTLVTANEEHMAPLLLDEAALRAYFFEVLPRLLEDAAARRLPVKLYPIFRPLHGLAVGELAAALREADPAAYTAELEAFAAGRYGAAFADRERCAVVGGKVLVRPDGEVYSCCEISHTGEQRMGRLGPDAATTRRHLPLLGAAPDGSAASTLTAIWGSPRYQQLRAATPVPLHPRCASCTEWFSRPPEALAKLRRPGVAARRDPPRERP